MAALLRSGKFLRVVSGVARHQINGPAGPNAPNAAPTLDGSGASSASSGQNWLSGNWDGGSTFQAWSLQHLHNSLPVLGKFPGLRNFRRYRIKGCWIGGESLVTVDLQREFANFRWQRDEKVLSAPIPLSSGEEEWCGRNAFTALMACLINWYMEA